MNNYRKVLQLNVVRNYCLSIAILLSIAPVLASATTHERNVIGEWQVIPGYNPQDPDLRAFAVHAALLKTGKVLMFAGSVEDDNDYPLNSIIWDPKIWDAQTGSGFSAVQTYGDDLFCSHHVFLPDGRLLVNGGGRADVGALEPLPNLTLSANKESYVFDPDSESWTKVGDMYADRWYPTTVALPADQGVLTFSGSSGTPSLAQAAEIFRRNQWALVNGSSRDLGVYYPGMHLLPNKKILYVSTRYVTGDERWDAAPKTALYDVDSTTWTDIGYLNVKDRTEGMSVALPGNRVMVIGGRGMDTDLVSTNSVEMIDFDDPTPSWTEVASMKYPRRNVNAVLLPTGKVLVTSGNQQHKFVADPMPVKITEEYDAETDKWRQLAPMTIARGYHSVSILLPDARVLNMGSVVDPDGMGNITSGAIKTEMEIFSPPYLFQGSRPTISNVQSEIFYGKSFDLETPDAASITKVVLVRPGAVTHHTDTEQRVIPLNYSLTNGTSLSIDGPDSTDKSIVGGYYMLFVINVINNEEVPSVATFVHLQESKMTWLTPVLEILE